jgi:hypothetical protein
MLLDQSFLFRTKSSKTDHYWLRYIIFIFSSHDSAKSWSKNDELCDIITEYSWVKNTCRVITPLSALPSLLLKRLARISSSKERPIRNNIQATVQLCLLSMQRTQKQLRSLARSWASWTDVQTSNQTFSTFPSQEQVDRKLDMSVHSPPRTIGP